MKKIVIALVGLFFLAACHKKDKKLDDLDKNLNVVLTNDQLSSANFCIIVPTVGCGGCIDNATKYLKNNIEKLPKTEIIFTGIVDEKLLGLEVGANFLKKRNVHIDAANAFQNFEVQSVYPQIVKMENGKPVQIKELDVNSNDMNELLKM